MQKNKNKKAHLICNILVILSIALAIFAIAFYNQLDKHMSEICEYKGRETANYIITTSIDKQLEGSKDEFIEVVRDENNEIVSLNTNTNAVNEIQNDLKQAINEEFQNIDDNNMSVPLGTLSGITLLSGTGPDVELQLHQVGAVDIEMKSEFISAGINQTKYRLLLTVTVELSAILPAHSTDITVEEDFLVAETIIIGHIPETFLNSNKL